jgi:hypothetical protein
LNEIIEWAISVGTCYHQNISWVDMVRDTQTIMDKNTLLLGQTMHLEFAHRSLIAKSVYIKEIAKLFERDLEEAVDRVLSNLGELITILENLHKYLEKPSDKIDMGEITKYLESIDSKRAELGAQVVEAIALATTKKPNPKKRCLF